MKIQQAAHLPCYIHGIAYTLGDKVEISTLEPDIIDSTTLARMHDLGLRYYRHSDSTPVELAAEVLMETLQLSSVPPNEIDVVIYSSVHAEEDALNALAFRNLLESLDLTNATPMGLTLADCANFGSTLRIAHSMLNGGFAKNILIVTADVCRNPNNRILTDTLSVLSDGAASCILTHQKESNIELLAISQKTNQLIRTAEASDLAFLVQQNLKQILTELVDQTGINLDSISQLIANNVNDEAVRFMSVSLGLDHSACYLDNIADFGHAHSADLLINLRTYLEDGISPGETVLALSHSYGIWGAGLLRING